MAALAGAGASVDAAVAIEEPRGPWLGRRRRQGAVIGGVPQAGVGRVGWRRGGVEEEKAAEGSGDEDGAGGRVSA